MSSHTSATPHILLVTGHPAAGKTTLAQVLAAALSLPLLCRDHIKETLADTIGLSPPAVGAPLHTNAEETHRRWSTQLGIASWTLFYQRIELLLQVGNDCVLESNFDPAYANAHWQRLRRHYAFNMMQIRCDTEPETLLARYQARIERGERHPIHKDVRTSEHFLATVRAGPLGWIDVESERMAIDTTALTPSVLDAVIQQIKTRFLLSTRAYT